MSKPVYLFEFTRNSVVVARRAASARDITALGYTWEASGISIDSDIELSGDAERDQVKITLPISDAWALDYLANPPEYATGVVIYRYERSDSTSEYVWQGRATIPEQNDGIITIPCDPDSTAAVRSTLPRIFMKQCPHCIFYGECRLDKADFAIAAELSAVSGVNITLEANSNLVAGDLTGGMIEAQDGTTRTIKIHSTATTLVLERKLKALSSDVASSNTSVTLYPGCDQTPERCAEFANADNPSGTNIENYGGFPWALTGDSNPFGGSSLT